MSIKNKSIKSALGSDTVNIAERIIDNIGNYISPRYLTHGDVEGYSDNEISPGDASDILEELNWKLIHIRDILEKAIDDDDITDTDELYGLRGAIDEADSFAKDTLTREAYNSLAMDIFHPIIRNFNVIRNSRKISSSQKGYENVVDGTPYDDYHIDTTGMGILSVEHIINEIEGRGNQAVLTVQTSDGAIQHTQFNAKDWKAYKDAVNGVDDFARNSGNWDKGAAITDVWVTEVKGGSYVRNSRRQIKSSKSAIDCFPVSEEEAEDIEELRETFPDDADLRAALEDYFDIYDDYAKMSVREFDTSFKEFIGSSKKIIKSNEELKSSGIGSIKDEFCLGQINDTQAELALQMEGKSKKDAKRIIEKWKENGVVKSSIDKAISRTEEYFGTTASNNTISCNDIITEADAINIRQIADEENVDVQVGDFSVRFFEKPEIIESSLIDKYIKQVGRLVKETDEGTINDDKSSRLNDRIDNIYDKLIDEKDPDIMYDRTEGQYTIKGQDVKRYVIEQLGDNYFEKNKSWDLLFDTILPNIQDFATTKEIAACYEVYEDCGNGKLKFISNTLDKNEALVFKNNGFVIKSSKIIVNSALTAGDEVVIEIERHGKWEMVSQTNDERGWSLNGDVAIFDTKDDAKKSKLAKDLEKSGYSPNRGNMRYKKYN